MWTIKQQHKDKIKRNTIKNIRAKFLLSSTTTQHLVILHSLNKKSVFSVVVLF